MMLPGSYLSVDGAFSEYTMLEAQKATTLRFKSETWDGPPSEWGDTSCGLSILASRSWSASSGQYEEAYGTEDGI